MKITPEGATLALETFCSVHPSKADVNKILAGMETYKDLLAYIVLETDFLDRNPDIKRIFSNYATSVTRTLTPSEEMKHIRNHLTRKISGEIYHLQKKYAQHSQEMIRIERDIEVLKRRIKGVNAS